MTRPFSALGVVGSLLLGGATISYYEEAPPSSMNPLFATTMVDYRTHELVFDRLFYRSPFDNALTSRVVAKHEKLEAGKALKIVLKDGIKWQDGEPLGPADVCFTVNAMLDPSTPSPVAKAYRDIVASCEELPKENAAILRLTRPFVEPREQLGFSLLPKHAFTGTSIAPDTDFSSRPIGTGAMKGVKAPKATRFDVFENPHHAAKIDVLNLGEAADPFIAVRTLVNGGVQGIINVAPAHRPDVAASDDLGLKSYDLRSWWFVALNTNKGALSDKRVRQALDVTLNRDELRQLTIGVPPDAEQSPCELISGPFVGASPYYNRKVLTHPTSDLASAAELMTSAGAVQNAGRWTWKDEPITLKIGINAALDKEAPDILNQIGNQLQAGGFDRVVYEVSTDEWARKAVTGQLKDFDLLIGKWAFGQAENVNPLFHTRKDGEGAYNVFDYSNADVDALLEKYDAAKTDTEARDAYHALHEKLADDLPYLFLWKLDTKSAWSNQVRNNTITPYFYFTEFDGWTFSTTPSGGGD